MDKRELYDQAGIVEFGIGFDEFAANTQTVLRQCGQQSAQACINNGFRPLLPAQAKAAARIWAEWDQQDAIAQTSNQVRKPKQLHHAHPSSPLIGNLGFA